jgi:osmotically-inducible protein OsmY
MAERCHGGGHAYVCQRTVRMRGFRISCLFNTMQRGTVMRATVVRSLAIAAAVAFSTGAAAAMTKAEYNSARAQINADYKAAYNACVPMKGETSNSCKAEARAKRKAARADLAARNAPAGKAAPAPVSKQETPTEYVDDSVITAKVKTAIFEDQSLKSSEINVETYKGIVQLSGFVRSRDAINRAVVVARGVKGVASVKNVMIVKGQQ